MSKLPQPFDNHSTYAGHSGVDYGEPTGKVIKASGNGTITFAGWWNDNAGWSTIVDYDNGPTVLYCHQPNMPGVKKGNRTFEGSQIGIVGSSGRSTGPHLHMEIMSGNGAHTYEGVWLYFDKGKVIGQGNISGEESNFSSQEDIVIILKATSDSKDGLIKKDRVFADSMTSPVTILSASEVEAIDYWKSKGIPYRLATWSGEAIRTLINTRGLHPFSESTGKTDYNKTIY